MEENLATDALEHSAEYQSFLGAQLRVAAVFEALPKSTSSHLQGLVRQVLEGDYSADFVAEHGDDEEHLIAWAACQGLTAEQAMMAYVQSVNQLLPGQEGYEPSTPGKTRYGEAKPLALEEPLAGLSGFAQRGDANELRHALNAAQAFAAQGGYAVQSAVVKEAGYGGFGRGRGAQPAVYVESRRGRGSGRANFRVPAWRLAEVDEEGRAPLHWAADRGHVACARLLLEAQAHPDPRDLEGMTPLAYAVTCEHREVASVLMEFGADPNVADHSGETPLMQCGATLQEVLIGATSCS